MKPINVPSEIIARIRHFAEGGDLMAIALMDIFEASEAEESDLDPLPDGSLLKKIVSGGASHYAQAVAGTDYEYCIPLTANPTVSPGRAARIGTLATYNGITYRKENGDSTGWRALPEVDAITAVRIDRNSLVPGRLDQEIWHKLSPLDLDVRSIAGDATDMRRSLVWVNSKNGGLAGGYLSLPFTVPTGVTQIVLELDDVQQSRLGATGAAALQLYDSTGITQVSSTSFTPGATATTVASSAITVIPGAEYQVRLVANIGGVASSFLCGRIRVRPATVDGSDAVFSAPFVRIDIDASVLQYNLETKVANPRYALQSPFSILGLKTNARRLIVQAYNNIGDFIGTGPGGNDNLSVKVNGSPLDPTLAPPVGVVSYNSIDLPAGHNRVEVTSGPQAINVLAAPVTETRGSFICAVYLPASAYVELLGEPAHIPGRTLVLDGDSKLAGFYSDVPGRDSLVELLRQRGFQVWCAAYGGGTLGGLWSSTISIPACAATAQKLLRPKPSIVIIGSGRNDVQGGSMTAANVITQRANAAEAIHAADPQVQVWLATFPRESDTIETADFATVRAGDVTTQSSRTGWCFLQDLGNLWSSAEAAAGQYTKDTVHPSSAGQQDIARVFAGDLYPWNPARLGTAALWWDPESGTTAGAMGAVTSSGTTPPTVTLTGTAGAVFRLLIQITTEGARGTARFRWSIDGGRSWMAQNVLTAATVSLAPTGITVGFAVGTYSTNNTYYSDTLVASAGSPALTGTGDITTIPAGMNNQRGFSCVGGSKYLRRTGLSIPTPYTLFLTGRLTNQSTPRALFGPGSGGNENAPTVYCDSASTMALAGGNAKQYQATVTASNAHSYVFVVNDANSYCWVDGVSTWGPLLIDAHTIQDVAVGARVAMSLWWDRDVGQGGIISRVCTNDEIRSFAAWARYKYGTP